MTAKQSHIRILKTGKFQPVKGAEVEFSEAMLKEIAESYDPKKHQAPIVIGHPKIDDPAFGWIKGVSFADGFLVAEPDQVDPQFADLVNGGKFKHVSASLYAPGAANNPTPGKWQLRHVGFLGAAPPAVKGLGAVSFADDEADTVTLEFAEEQFASGWDLQRIAGMFRRFKNWMIDKEGQEAADSVLPEWEIEGLASSGARKDAAAMQANSFSEAPPVTAEPDPKLAQQAVDLAEREATLAAEREQLAAERSKIAEQQKALRDTAITDFADQQLQQGRITPAQRPMVVTLLQQLDGDQTVSLGEGDAAETIPAADAFRRFIETIPKQIDLSERGAPGDSIDLADGEAVGRAAKQLVEAEATKGNTISATEAVRRVTEGA